MNGFIDARIVGDTDGISVSKKLNDLQQNTPTVFPNAHVVVFDNITVGNIVLTWNPVQLGTITLA